MEGSYKPGAGFVTCEKDICDKGMMTIYIYMGPNCLEMTICGWLWKGKRFSWT